MNVKEALGTYDALMARAQDIANRWSQAYGPARYVRSGYDQAMNVTIDVAAGLIRFVMHSSPSGMNPSMEMPIQFLHDDVGLVEATRAAYIKEYDERSAISDEISRIKASPEYQRLIKLEQQLNPWHNRYL